MSKNTNTKKTVNAMREAGYTEIDIMSALGMNDAKETNTYPNTDVHRDLENDVFDMMVRSVMNTNGEECPEQACFARCATYELDFYTSSNGNLTAQIELAISDTTNPWNTKGTVRTNITPNRYILNIFKNYLGMEQFTELVLQCKSKGVDGICELIQRIMDFTAETPENALPVMVKYDPQWDTYRLVRWLSKSTEVGTTHKPATRDF